MALTNVELVNLAIGNTAANPFYPLLSDVEVQAILDMVDGDVILATKKAAQSAYFIVISIPAREKIGDIELFNNYASEYRLALEQMIKSSDYSLPKGLMPYAGGISEADYISVENNPDRHTSRIQKAVKDTSPNKYWWDFR